MRTATTIALSALVLTACTTPCFSLTLISPYITNPANGHKYALIQQANWSLSEAAAVQFGGHLTTIRSASEQNFVFRTFGGYLGQQHLLWIGLTDVGSPPLQFHWTSGEPITYTNWDTNEPNNASGSEFYTAMYYPNFRNPGAWNDWNSRTADPIGIPFNGVVELSVPEPSVFALLLAGSLTGTIALRRRRHRLDR